jgi:hypothetical protein
MLRPITSWSHLSRALEARGQRVYQCAECAHVWIASAENPPVRCPRRECRAWADSPLRESTRETEVCKNRSETSARVETKDAAELSREKAAATSLPELIE